ncbi:hypothetical protein SUGI_0014750 [Cryptomeria japonica]|nr:hypothetical protein SUGI_0014750 [Cryptomeria japonica]
MGMKSSSRWRLLNCMRCENAALVEGKGGSKGKISNKRLLTAAIVLVDSCSEDCHKGENPSSGFEEKERSFKTAREFYESFSVSSGELELDIKSDKEEDSVEGKQNSQEESCSASHEEGDEARELEREKRRKLEWPIMRYRLQQTRWIRWYPDLDAIPEVPSP